MVQELRKFDILIQIEFALILHCSFGAFICLEVEHELQHFLYL